MDPDRLFVLALVLITISCAIIGAALLFVRRFGLYSKEVQQARAEIRQDREDAKRSYLALERSALSLVDELYKLRQKMYPPRHSPPTGNPQPHA